MNIFPSMIGACASNNNKINDGVLFIIIIICFFFFFFYSTTTKFTFTRLSSSIIFLVSTIGMNNCGTGIIINRFDIYCATVG